MFRFSVRDLLWLTLVVALALGWLLREKELQVCQEQAWKWRRAAGVLEHVLKRDRYSLLVWDLDGSRVTIFESQQPLWGNVAGAEYSFHDYEPSDRR